jgi:hypothetical protein
MVIWGVGREPRQKNEGGLAYRAGKSDTPTPVLARPRWKIKISVACACKIATGITTEVDCDYDLNFGVEKNADNFY